MLFWEHCRSRSYFYGNQFYIGFYSSNRIDDVKIVIKGYEFGPAVPKLVVKLNQKFPRCLLRISKVETAGVKRQIKKSLSIWIKMVKNLQRKKAIT